MKKLLLTVVTVVFWTMAGYGAEKSDEEIAQHLQDISVTIVSKSKGEHGEGSGVVKTLFNEKGEKVNYVWTAAHVISNLRHERQVIDGKSGGSKTIVEFDDAIVVKSINEDGRMVGKIEFLAEVVRYSSDEDFALLRLRKKDLVKSSVTFYLEQKDEKPIIPPIGTELIHVGSLLGQMGSNSMTRGIMSQHGRLVNKIVFDQTTVAAFHGSSGGGVYLKDGRLIGLVLRGAGETFNLIGPVRRLHDWSKRAGVDWAVDDKIKMPSEADLKKLPIEDNGVTFSYSARKERSSDDKDFIKSFFGQGRFYLGTEELESKFPTLIYLKK
jgi:hypothetical protein